MYDIALRGGTVVDGTGRPGVVADVGITDGRIVEVGRLSDDARAVVDASGRVVAPGFVDIHTHYDAQAFWDPFLGPSPLHGVTTVVGGNCGFSVAPLDEANADYLMRMLARVEGMPVAVLESSVPWNWRSTAEYLDRLEGTLAVNAGFMVGHSAMRRVVMGDAAIERHSTPDERAAMAAFLRAGLAAGGLGFSTSRGQFHKDHLGNPVPSSHAAPEEFLELAAIAGEFPGTSLEYIPTSASAPFDADERAFMTAMSAGAHRPLNWNLVQGSVRLADVNAANLALGDEAAASGGSIVGLTIPMELGVRYSFLTAFNLDALVGWGPTMKLPPAERLAALRDTETRHRLGESAREESSAKRSIGDWADLVIHDPVAPENAWTRGKTVGEIAATQGQEPFDALLDVVCSDELLTSFGRPLTADTRADWEARATLWRDRRAVIGGSDAGAHVDQITAYTYTTSLLARGVREHGLLTVEEAVHQLTDVPARLYGIVDRGRLAVGGYADVVVFDPDTIAPAPVETRLDLPGGAPRLYASAQGVEHVLVNGTPIVSEGRPTAARPGTVLRSGRDTDTPRLG